MAYPVMFFLKKTASRTLIKRMELILDISSSMSMLFCAFYSPVAGVLADRDILEFTLELHALYCTTRTVLYYTAQHHNTLHCATLSCKTPLDYTVRVSSTVYTQSMPVHGGHGLHGTLGYTSHLQHAFISQLS